MNWAHVHLLVTHVPILGYAAAAALALAALLGGDAQVWARAAMVAIAASFVGMAIAFFGGSPALDVISGQPRTSARALAEHHVRAIYGSIAGVVTGVLAAVTAVVARRNGGALSRPLLGAVFVASLVAAGALGWTGLAGGRINHPEVQESGDRERGPARPH
jgi:hypothetical protein